MKRVSYRMLFGLLFVGLFSLSLPGFAAQEEAKQGMRSEVAAFLSKFVTAANQGDTTTLMTMISSKPAVSSAADGHLTRGASEIAKNLGRLVGKQGKYQLQLGTMDISNVNGLALVTGSYHMDVK